MGDPLCVFDPGTTDVGPSPAPLFGPRAPYRTVSNATGEQAPAGGLLPGGESTNGNDLGGRGG